MSKVMLVNATHPEESRVAILTDGILNSYEIETTNRAHIKGNIHNAVVETTHASLEAAFVRLGPDLKGFLPLDEVNFKLLPAHGEKGKSGRIGQHLRAGQKLMVQVVREPFGGKPPTVSTYFSLPGRFLVLMPGVDSAGVSRRIEDPEQREKLKDYVKQLQPPDGFGIIVRTAGIGQTKTELQRDLRYLLRLWKSIQQASPKTEFPGLVYQERDMVIRTVRDHLAPDVKEIWIDDDESYARARDFMKRVMPAKAKILKRYEGGRPLFNKFNLEEQIESIYQRKVRLPSGGEIVIDGTEALTAIDVNSARAQRKASVEEVATSTNLEAASEIGRQLRLRDLGGLVVVDFIDMNQAKNRKKVERAMKDALKGDRAKFDVTPISKLGLLEIARQRLKSAKLGASYATCPTCDGHGMIKHIEAAALSALRKLQTRSTRGRGGTIRLELPEAVAVWLLNHKRDEIARTERRQQARIEIRPADDLLRHESRFSFEPGAAPPKDVGRDRPRPAETAERPAERAPAESEKKAAEGKADDAESAAGDPEEAKPKRRTRRGRRGGRRRGRKPREENDGNDAAAAESAPPAEAPDTAAIRADELMPAAAPRSGSGRGRRARGGRGGSGR